MTTLDPKTYVCHECKPQETFQSLSALTWHTFHVHGRVATQRETFGTRLVIL